MCVEVILLINKCMNNPGHALWDHFIISRLKNYTCLLNTSNNNYFQINYETVWGENVKVFSFRPNFPFNFTSQDLLGED